MRPWRLLVLDEGTSALDESHRERLFAYLREARGEGRSVLFTSHRMDELVQLADRVTVLRLGATVAETADGRDLAARDPRADGRAGRPRSARWRRPRRTARPGGTPARPARPWSTSSTCGCAPASAPISLTLRAGEILGLAGLEGQGQVDFATALCGLSTPAEGRVVVRSGDADDAGRRVPPRDAERHRLRAARAQARGPLLLAVDAGQLLGADAAHGEPPGLPALARASGTASAGRPSACALTYRHESDLVGTLSGGNQQKVLLGRWLTTSPRVLVLNDPLRGVDANTKEELYELFRELADEGLAIVFVSTEILELLVACDRIGVFHAGRLEALLDAGEASETSVVAAMFGHGETEREEAAL